MIKFQERTAVITGAAGGIGRALAHQFMEQNVAMALTDLSEEAVEKQAMELRQQGAVVRGYALDVTSTASVNAAATRILSDFSHIDILVNNAGVWNHPDRKVTPLADTPEEYWKWVLDVNLAGVFRTTQAFLKPMIHQQYGRIINLGSIAGEVGLPGYCDYSAAKGGVILMTKALAMEVAKHKITVNCVSPGMVSSNDSETTPTRGTWIGRTGARAEIAGLILFLASDDSSFITGVDYTIDGGRILGPRGCDF